MDSTTLYDLPGAGPSSSSSPGSPATVVVSPPLQDISESASATVLGPFDRTFTSNAKEERGESRSSALIGGAARADRAEKTADNPDNPFGSRFRRGQSSTPTAVSQLFAAPPSPAYSRSASDVRFPSGQVRSAEKSSLAGHLYNQGLLQGRHSDIKINAFGKSYALHRLILERSPFFEAAFSGPWKEASAAEITLYPSETDANITVKTFELALKRLYGCHDVKQENDEAIGLLATASWLDMQDLVDECVNYTLEKLGLSTIGPLIDHLSKHDYGTAGQKILAAAKSALCRVGIDLPFAMWDEIPSTMIRELVASDCFYVQDEHQRFLLAKEILDRRLHKLAAEFGITLPDHRRSSRIVPSSHNKAIRPSLEHSVSAPTVKDPSSLYAHPTIRPLLDLLDHGIYYVHLEFEQLQRMKAWKDIFGNSILPDHIVKDALWSHIEFREKIVNSAESLRLFSCDKRHDCHEERRFSIPQADRNVIVGGSADPATTNSIFQTELKVDGASEDDKPWTPRLPDSILAKQTDHAHFPPFRFAAEFPDPHLRREGKRTYSRTVFYAGSYWNLYIQKVCKNGRQPQLGVYVHRTKEQDEHQLGNRSRESVDQRILRLERELGTPRQPSALTDIHRRSALDDEDRTLVSSDGLRNARLAAFLAASNASSSTLPYQPPHQRRATMSSNIASYSSSPDDNNQTLGALVYNDQPDFTTRPVPTEHVPAIAPYTDARQTVITYFKIFSPSRSGRMMSVYESAPDHFDFSQSWGWKSNALMVNDLGAPNVDAAEASLDVADEPSVGEGAGEESEEQEALELQAEKIEGGLADGRLRFMVVLGVV